MLTTNVDVSDVFSNSAKGTVSNVVTRLQYGKLLVEAILVEFDSEEVGTEAVLQSKYKDVNYHAVPIE